MPPRPVSLRYPRLLDPAAPDLFAEFRQSAVDLRAARAVPQRGRRVEVRIGRPRAGWSSALSRL